MARQPTEQEQRAAAEQAAYRQSLMSSRVLAHVLYQHRDNDVVVQIGTWLVPVTGAQYDRLHDRIILSLEPDALEDAVISTAADLPVT